MILHKRWRHYYHLSMAGDIGIGRDGDNHQMVYNDSNILCYGYPIHHPPQKGPA